MKKVILSSLGLLALLALGACRAAPKFQIREVYAGVGHVFIMKDDGSLWAAGYNHFGQLGLGDYQDAEGSIHPRTLVQVMGGGAALEGVKAAAPGESHTLLLMNDGTLRAAGDDSFGALGLGGGDAEKTEKKVKVFTQVMSGGSSGDPVRGVKAIAAGADSSFFIKDDGSLWAAGYNIYGQLGLDNAGDPITPVFTRVSSAGNDVKAVAAGNRHTAILKNDGSLWTTGNNYYGQLGLGEAEGKAAFTQVIAAGTDNQAVAAGNNHTVILKNDGSLWAAGGNYSGQLGLGDFENRPAFTRAGLDKAGGSPMAGIREIAANGDDTLVLKSDGSFWAAGDNVYGQLGQKNEEFEFARNVFIPINTEAAPKNAAVPLSAGARSLYFVGADGALRGAGSNRYGQLNLGPEVEDSPEVKALYP